MKFESAWNRLALLCFAINHHKRCAECAVGAAEVWHGTGGNFPERRGRGRQRSMELKVCFSMKLLFKLACWHISQHMMGNYQRIGVGAGPVSCGEVTNQSTQCPLSIKFLCVLLFFSPFCVHLLIGIASAEELFEPELAGWQTSRMCETSEMLLWEYERLAAPLIKLKKTGSVRDGGVNQHKRASPCHK